MIRVIWVTGRLRISVITLSEPVQCKFAVVGAPDQYELVCWTADIRALYYQQHNREKPFRDADEVDKFLGYVSPKASSSMNDVTIGRQAAAENFLILRHQCRQAHTAAAESGFWNICVKFSGHLIGLVADSAVLILITTRTCNTPSLNEMTKLLSYPRLVARMKSDSNLSGKKCQAALQRIRWKMSPFH